MQITIIIIITTVLNKCKKQRLSVAADRPNFSTMQITIIIIITTVLNKCKKQRLSVAVDRPA